MGSIRGRVNREAAVLPVTCGFETGEMTMGIGGSKTTAAGIL